MACRWVFLFFYTGKHSRRAPREVDPYQGDNLQGAGGGNFELRTALYDQMSTKMAPHSDTKIAAL